jgi:hypothetical protein
MTLALQDFAEFNSDDCLNSLGVHSSIITEVVEPVYLATLSRPAEATADSFAVDMRTNVYQDLLQRLKKNSEGWGKEVVKGQHRLVNRISGVRILLGKARFVGDRRYDPEIKRGASLRELLESTQTKVRGEQLELDVFGGSSRECVGVFTGKTYFLLYERRGNQLLLEVAEPLVMDDAGYVIKWDKRIYLPAISAIPENDPLDIVTSDNERVDVPVVRKRKG